MKAKRTPINRNFLGTVAAMLMLITPIVSRADEGAMQVYIPGVYGSIHMAMVPEPGSYFLNLFVLGDLQADLAQSGGETWTDLDVPLVANAFVPIWVLDKEIWGGNYFLAVGTPLVGYQVDATLVSGGPTDAVISYDSWGLSDIYFVPFGVTWKNHPGLFTFLYLGINVPVGKYTLGNPKNIGLNHWAFDTNFALSWEIPNSNWELDFDLGFMFNLENSATDYKSGADIHLDWTVGYNFTKKFSAGVSGYFYQQITGDTGTGATLGSFKGEGVGLGLSATYMFTSDKHRSVSVTAEWITDVHTKNRYDGDYFTLQIAFPLGDSHF